MKTPQISTPPLTPSHPPLGDEANPQEEINSPKAQLLENQETISLLRNLTQRQAQQIKTLKADSKNYNALKVLQNKAQYLIDLFFWTPEPIDMHPLRPSRSS